MSVVMLDVVMLDVVMLDVVMLNVVAPEKKTHSLIFFLFFSFSSPGKCELTRIFNESFLSEKKKKKFET